MFRVLLFFVAAAVASAAPPAFRDSDGATHQPLGKGAEQKATVLLFLMADCPVANAMAPELARIATEYGKRGVRFYAVYATTNSAEVASHRRDYRLPFPGLLDPKCSLARGAGATRVPEAAVYSADERLLYRGRIDDRAVKVGRIKPQPARRDLRAALDAILAGKSPNPAMTEAVGCYLPL